MIPTDSLHIVLHQPEIPPNTGNIIRLCANTGCKLHLIEPLGFKLEEKALRRAGLDYHQWASMQVHASFNAFWQTFDHKPSLYICTTRGEKHHSDVAFKKGDALLFGSETKGLPDDLHQHADKTASIRIPMMDASRSLNLANSVAVVAYEALRQMDYPELH